jgi:cytochrome c-type biogenesis protein CcmF
MDYLGEQLLPGKLGHFFVLLSVVSSLVATLSYFLSTQSKNIETANDWKKLARLSFVTEVISVFAIFIILFYIISNHRFEYKYAWQHSSLSLEVKYLLACFWEGQEGSFLLWSIWHCIIGLILIKTAKKWEAPVMTVLSFAQLSLAAMIAGIYVFGERIGSDPFVLLRDSGVLDNAPALHIGTDVTQPLRTDYLSFIKDGNDLNPLLQNYWMVIHPPVLFLGFASSIVPFAYAIAGLWKKQHGKTEKADWINPALPWSLFCIALLGTGIMMGAMWAYESLTFGGYWAWDPVENASLVPWLVVVSGAHTLLIYKHSGRALQATYIFLIMGFVLVLYSTFLTRSGILGDTSVHSFTDLGLNAQLYLLLFTFLWGCAILTAKHRDQKIYFTVAALVLLLASRYVPVPKIAFITLIAGLTVLCYNIFSQVGSIKEEEKTSSREFWMFIGSLVLFLSSIIIIFITSFPVINKVFGAKLATPENIMHYHNTIQIFFAVVIATLSGVGQYLKYKKTTQDYFLQKIIIPLVLSAGIGFAAVYFGNINYKTEGAGFQASIWLAVTASIFTIVANIGYIWLGLKGDLKISGASVAHFGFGLVLLGILISASKKEILSNNINGVPVPLAETENPIENLTLLKGVPSEMSKYTLTYESDSIHPKKQQWYYNIRFQSKDGKENFVLKPDAFVNYKGNEGLMANPAAKHYWTHDVFTYITSLPNPDKMVDTSNFRSKLMHEGDTSFYSNGYIILENLKSRDSIPGQQYKPTDRATLATFKVHSKYNATYTTDKVLLLDLSGQLQSYPDTIHAEGLVLRLNKVEGPVAEVGIKDSNTITKYITLKAYKFPMIRLLWFGVLITVIGTLMSMIRRISQNRRNKVLS